MLTTVQLPPVFDPSAHPKKFLLPQTDKFMGLDVDSLDAKQGAILFMRWAHYWHQFAMFATQRLEAAEASAQNKFQDTQKNQKSKSKPSSTSAEGSASVNPGDTSGSDIDIAAQAQAQHVEAFEKMVEEHGFKHIAELLGKATFEKSSTTLAAPDKHEK